MADHAQVSEADDQVRTLLRLIGDLICVVEDENAALAKGLPASRLTQIEAKTRLAELFERRVADCSARKAALEAREPGLREALMERILALRAVMDENVVRIRAAMDASNRRIEALMQAIREQLANDTPYTSNGRAPVSAASSGLSRIA